MFYSPSKNAFYAPEFRVDFEAAGTWPDDAREISAALYAEVAANRPAGKILAPGANGLPTLIDPAPPTLEELKAAKNAEINAARMAANYSTFEHAGKLFACDALSRSDIDGTANHIALFDTFPPEFPGAWKALDNSYLPMATIADFKAFYQSMTAAGTANFLHAQQLKAQLGNAATAEQVAEIAW